MTAVTCSRTATVTFPTDRQVLITREVDAPRHLVYRAWTTPELVRRWWSGRRGQMTVVEIDLRVGGRWRYVMVGDDGQEVAFHGDTARSSRTSASSIPRCSRGHPLRRR